jgi:hypothetical protein
LFFERRLSGFSNLPYGGRAAFPFVFNDPSAIGHESPKMGNRRAYAGASLSTLFYDDGISALAGVGSTSNHRRMTVDLRRIEPGDGAAGEQMAEQTGPRFIRDGRRPHR